MNTRHGSKTFSFAQAYTLLAEAARDKTPVQGWTHNFYRYPARFSPHFARAAIEQFSKRGDLICDPYMGGGTTLVEALAAGRHAVGNDLNSLAAFIARVKTTPIRTQDASAILDWMENDVPDLGFNIRIAELQSFIDAQKTRNLSIAKARFIKRALADGLASATKLVTKRLRNFVRCALLRVGQWALDGRERPTSVQAFRERLAETTEQMLMAALEFSAQKRKTRARATIIHGDATDLAKAPVFSTRKASLIVTSPPYPGVHVLYHRWQVDGRRESPAPYWIAGCNDGQGGSYYNFADRREEAAIRYFEASLRTLKGIRQIIRDGGHMIQMIAFNRPTDQLPRYLANMELAGFAEVSLAGAERIWRQVPGRKWHARQMGKTNSANEVVLIHRAV